MHLQGKTFSLHREFTICTPNGEELVVIKRKIAKIVGEEFWIEQNGQEIMRVFGDFTEHEYQMQVAGSTVAEVHRKWITMRVIVIEHVEVTERQSNSGS